MKNIGIFLLIVSISLGCSNPKPKEPEILKFEVVGNYSFGDSLGVTCYEQTISVTNFDETDPKCWEELENDGMTKPYKDGGFTAVFYFNKKENTPTFQGPHFAWDSKYDSSCIALYWVYPTGLKEFKRYPLRNF